ncbi:MAG: MT-A70 family methyltransferase [Planctomycetota bacterium]
MDVLEALDRERDRQGLTKQELAVRAGLQAPAVRRVLTGRANPTLSTLSILADALGLEISLQPGSSTTWQITSKHEVLSPVCSDLLGLGLPDISTVLADPPWQFQNRTGKVAPEHKRLSRYDTMSLDEICALPVSQLVTPKAHLYLWVPNALINEGLRVMASWGFQYKANLVWAKRRKDGGPDGRGVGFYFRNVTELVLFGVRGSLRTRSAGRRQVNMIETRKREHSRKPDELYDIVEACSPGPYLELFSRHPRQGWHVWGHESDHNVKPRGKQHAGYRGGEINAPLFAGSGRR